MAGIGGIGKQGVSGIGKPRIDVVSRTAAAFFGTRKAFATQPGNVFAASNAGQADRARLEAIATGQIREREHLQGFRTNLTPSEKQSLAGLQDKIAKLEKAAPPDGLGAKAVRERADLVQQAYRILGKDWVDVEANPELSVINEEIKTLREPRLDAALKRRVDSLRSLKGGLKDRIGQGDDSRSTQAMFIRVVRQIDRLLPPRSLDKFSPEEIRRYDELVGRANAIARQEVLAPAKKQKRIEALQGSIRSIQVQIASLPGPQSAPSPRQTAAAYTRGVR